MGKPEGKRPHKRLKRGYLDNMRINRENVRWEGVDWIDLA